MRLAADNRGDRWGFLTWSKISSKAGLRSGCSLQHCFISWIHSRGAWSGDTTGRHSGGEFLTFWMTSDRPEQTLWVTPPRPSYSIYYWHFLLHILVIEQLTVVSACIFVISPRGESNPQPWCCKHHALPPEPQGGPTDSTGTMHATDVIYVYAFKWSLNHPPIPY